MQIEDYLQAPRLQSLRDQAESSQMEDDKKRFLIELVREILKGLNDVTITNIKNGINVNNLDEIKASLRNELNKANKPITDILNKINLSAESQNKFLEDVQNKAENEVDNTVQTVVVKRLNDKTEITNFSDIIFPSEVSVNNLTELASYLEELINKVSELKLSVTLPAPQVTIQPTPVNIPETVLNIPPLDLEPIISSLNENLKLLRTNNKSRPLAVRLTDGAEWIKELIKTQKETSKAVAAFAGGSNQVRLLDSNNGIINPVQQEPEILRAIANISASQTDSSIVTAVTGKKIRIVAVAAVAAATATNITFNTKPAGAGTGISPVFANGANGGEVLPYNPRGWFETNSGEGLTATTGSGSATGVLINYILV